MPALPPVPQVIRLIFTQKANADTDIVTRLYVHYTGTVPTNATLGAWLTVMSANWASNVSPLQSFAHSLVSIAAADLSSPTAAVSVNNTTHVGTRSGQGIPASNAALINYLVQRRYRGGKPRSYLLAGVATDVDTGQLWLPAFTTAVQTGWGNFTGALSTSPPTGSTITGLVNVSYYSGFTVHTGSTGRAKNISTPRATPLVDTISGFTVDPEYGTQRRRARP